VADANGQPAGYLIASVPVWTDAAEVTGLAVDIAQRRTGAGSALIEGAAGWARERGLRAIWTEPRADNAAAIAFYTAMGFRLAGFNDRMHSNSDDEPGRRTLLMYLELRP
jgi:ribosomal protein S18 acetylase RimI-like enzyme